MWLRAYPKGLHMLITQQATPFGSLYRILGCSTVAIAKGMGQDLRTEMATVMVESWNRILWWQHFGLMRTQININANILYIIQILDILGKLYLNLNE